MLAKSSPLDIQLVTYKKNYKFNHLGMFLVFILSKLSSDDMTTFVIGQKINCHVTI